MTKPSAISRAYGQKCKPRKVDDLQEVESLVADEKKYLAEQHLMNFTQQAWPYVHQGVEFLYNWHLRLICELLMAVSLGWIKRLIINIPPRYSKSTLVSIMWPCWEWAVLNPSQRWVFVSYVKTLSEEMSLKRRDLIQSDWYQKNWGNVVQLRSDRNRVADFLNDKKGAMFSTSTGGALTGKGGNRLVIDDPTSPQEAISNAAREQANDWYYNTFNSRTDDKKRAAIVMIQQRLNQRDMTGFLTGIENTEIDGYLHHKNGWVLVRIPLIAEMDEVIRSPLTNEVIKEVHEGELLWPEREGPEQVAEHKRDEFTFASQQQQHPSSKRGAIFQRSWFQFYDKLPVFPDAWIMSMDTNYKVSSTSDYVAIGVWAWKKPNMYLEYQLREKLSFTETEQAVREIVRAYPDISAKLIEEAANGAGIIDRLHSTIGGIIPIHPGESKLARAQAVTPYFRSGNVFVKMAPWTHDYMSEMINFDGTPSSKTKKDDQCFVAGTMIATTRGYIKIETVKPGDKVIVPGGVAKVKAAGCTGNKRVISNLGLIGTENHPVMISRKLFIPLNQITQSITTEVDRLCIKNLLCWGYLKLLYSMESNTGLWERDDITLASQLQLKGKSMLKDFMLRSMNFILEKKYRKAMWFITRTITRSITTTKILCVFNVMNTLNSLEQQTKCLLTSKMSDHQQLNGTKAKKVKNGIVSNLRSIGVSARRLFASVFGAEKSSKLIGQKSMDTNLGDTKDTTILKRFALCVETCLRLLKISIHQEQGKLAAGHVQCCSEQNVFNLEVEGPHVYYANGILVSNCDQTTQAIEYMQRTYGNLQSYDDDETAVARFISSGR